MPFIWMIWYRKCAVVNHSRTRRPDAQIFVAQIRQASNGDGIDPPRHTLLEKSVFCPLLPEEHSPTANHDDSTRGQT